MYCTMNFGSMRAIHKKTCFPILSYNALTNVETQRKALCLYEQKNQVRTV
jgi:hypothetical protein